MSGYKSRTTTTKSAAVRVLDIDFDYDEFLAELNTPKPVPGNEAFVLNHWRPWTDADINSLVESYSANKSRLAIAKQLGRSVLSITSKAKSLKLRRSVEYRIEHNKIQKSKTKTLKLIGLRLTIKRCGTCGRWKTSHSYTKNKRDPWGLGANCRRCNRRMGKLYWRLKKEEKSLELRSLH